MQAVAQLDHHRVGVVAAVDADLLLERLVVGAVEQVEAVGLRRGDARSPKRGERLSDVI